MADDVGYDNNGDLPSNNLFTWIGFIKLLFINLIKCNIAANILS